MNKKAVAIAADSAVTRQGKVFTSARKIYELSKDHPVGIMVYGKAEFMGVPWVSIIRKFRERIGSKELDSLDKYGEELLDLLEKNAQLTSFSEEKRYFFSYLHNYFQQVKQEIHNTVETAMEREERVSDEQIEEITSRIIEKHYNKWLEKETLSNFSKEDVEEIENKFGEELTLENKQIFENLPITEDSLEHVRSLGANLISKRTVEVDKRLINQSGVVVAGFGKGDLFPAIYPLEIEGKILGNLKYTLDKTGTNKITRENGASVKAFAQWDVMATFMEGVDPRYQQLISQILSKVLQDYPSLILEKIEEIGDEKRREYEEKLSNAGVKQLKKRLDELNEYRKREFVNPIMNVVMMLPKRELAEMAESLVNLTSLKRKLSMEQETVAGPTDVAVISKDEGFRWNKRKDYQQLE